MPTYEYTCKKCGIVEVFQSMKEDALRRCPTCRSAGFQRIISGGAGVIFKGSGFWETDYNRGADYKKKAQDESDARAPKSETAPPVKSESKAESKPELKPEPKAAPKREPITPPKSTPPASPPST